MNIRHLLTIFITFSIGLSLNAGTVCEAPAPTSAQIVSQANESAVVSWSAVPGAQSYQIKTTETGTGAVVATEIVTTTIYTRNSLTPGQEYSFEISASYCPLGPFGEGLGIDFQTEIIIVDVILQMECGNSAPQEEGQYSAGDISTIELDPSGCYVMNLKTLSANPQIEIDLALSQLPNGMAYVGNFADNPEYFALNGNGPLFGMLNAGSGNLPLFRMSSLNNQGNSYMNVEWMQNLNVTLSRCSSCELIKGDGGRPLQMDYDLTTEIEAPADIQLAPNPAWDILQVDLPEAGQIEVWDLTGRRWASLGKDNPQHHFNLDVRNWPAGTYLVRWHSPDNPPGIRYFLKHNY